MVAGLRGLVVPLLCLERSGRYAARRVQSDAALAMVRVELGRPAGARHARPGHRAGARLESPRNT